MNLSWNFCICQENIRSKCQLSGYLLKGFYRDQHWLLASKLPWLFYFKWSMVLVFLGRKFLFTFYRFTIAFKLGELGDHSKSLTPGRWGLEYTDCIPCREVRSASQLRLSRLWHWNASNCKTPILMLGKWGVLHCHYSLVRSILEGRIYGSNKSVWKLFVLDWNTWCHITVNCIKNSYLKVNLFT